MSFETFAQYPPVDGELVDRIVCKLKSQGIFDQFRKDCMADVDTKPAYQNLQQRVNGTVATFLATQTWQQDLNKTQLRESLRRHVQQGFLEVGVDRIVDQVVNPKVFTVFMPKVEDVVYDCLGIEKPKHPPSSNNLLAGRKLTLLDLLPQDLDPVSPDSDNLSFDEDETKDEANNNESSSKLDISHDSQVSGISDLSSHMGDSFKDIQENNIDSSTVKSISSVKENSSEPHFENFENLSEKIKQAEIGGHNSATSPLPEEQNDIESKEILEVEQNQTKHNRDDALMEIDSVSNSTFDDSKMFANKIIKEDTCSRTLSEDSLSCSSFNSKFKKDKSKSVVLGISENSMDKSEVDTPCKEISSDKEVKISPMNDNVDIKTEEKVMESKDPKKTDELKDKKHRESSSSKTGRSSKPSDSKHRSSTDKKDDIKQSKEKTYKEDKDKEKSSRDDKEKSSKYKDDRHHSSKDKYKEKDKNDRSREKDNDKKKDISEKDKKSDKDKYKDKDKNDKEKTRNDKENNKYEKDKSRSEKDKDRHEKEKDKYDRDKHDKSKRDKDKEKREKDKYESKEKDRDINDKDKDRNEKDKSRERDRGKSEKDCRTDKDKENRSIDEKREDKKRDSKKYDKTSSSSSVKKDDNTKNETKDKSRRSDENGKEKTSNSKSGKNEEEKRERKRKSERCNDEIKLKEARRSWDRDSSGGNGKGHGSQKSNSSECKVSSSSSSTKEKRTGESSNQQKANERKLDSVSEAEEPSDVDKILMKINSSIEESQNNRPEEQPIKKPKIARNIFEIRKIMQARKNIARQAFKLDKKRKEMMISVVEVDGTDSPSTTEPPSRDSPKIREENKENIKSGQMDKLKNPKVSPIKGKFNGFLESDIEQSRNSLQIFRAHFSSFCTSMGMEVSPSENIERVDFSKICDLSDDLLDDNLNKLKPKQVSLERRKTYPDDNQVSKAVENIMSGKNGCYVLLKDCTEVVEAMRNATQPQLNQVNAKPIPSKLQQIIGVEEDSNRISSGKILDLIPKNETLTPAVKPVPQLETSVGVETDIVSPDSQEQLKQQGNSARKAGIRTPPAQQQLTQDNKDEEAFSPVADVTIALNTYLNDSKEILPSVPLTEAMLDNLMQQSSIVVEDETFTDSDESIHESSSVQNLESDLRKEESDLRTGDVSDSSYGLIIRSDDLDNTANSERISNIISSTCDIFSNNKDDEETSGNKVVKQRNQRVCRSASQRYDSTDLYKPRPVLPQNSKRVRTPRSVSSEDVSTREQYEGTPSRKRAR